MVSFQFGGPIDEDDDDGMASKNIKFPSDSVRVQPVLQRPAMLNTPRISEDSPEVTIEERLHSSSSSSSKTTLDDHGHGRASLLRPYKFPDFRISKDMSAGRWWRRRNIIIWRTEHTFVEWNNKNKTAIKSNKSIKKNWNERSRDRKDVFLSGRVGGSSGLQGSYGFTDHVPSHRPPWPCPYQRSSLVTRTWRSVFPLQEKFKLIWSILLIRHVVS